MEGVYQSLHAHNCLSDYMKLKAYLEAAGGFIEALRFKIGTYAISVMSRAYHAGLRCGSYLSGRSA